MNWDSFQRDIEAADQVFVYDELSRDREGFASLRKLPALSRLTEGRTTYPKSWRKLDQWSTNQFEFDETPFIVLDEIGDQPTFDLLAITDQFYEDEYPIFTLGMVLSMYSAIDQQLIIAGDDAEFQPAGAHRPLVESPAIDENFDYRRVFDAFEDRYERAGLAFPLRGSQNLFLQDNAILYELVTGTSLDSVTDVFYCLPEAPYLPLWETITDIFSAGVSQGTRLLDQDTQQGLSKWIRRRIEVSYSEGQDLASYLNHLSRRHEPLFNPHRRARRPQCETAQDRLSDTEIDDEGIASRYRTWIGGDHS